MTVSHSELLAKKILDHYFSRFRKLDNYRPVWLQGMELDRFYPDLGLAIEFQGRQHFMRVSEFNQTPESFEQQLRNDQRKRVMVEGQGIKLLSLDVFDLKEDRMKRYAEQIKMAGLRHATGKGMSDIVKQLQSLRLDKPADPTFFKSADRLSRVKSKAKKSFWSRIFGG